MADIWPVGKRSQVMSRIRGKGNKSTELVLVKLFREHRITGWRRHLPLPGKPDFCFVRQKVAVFVDGCFWHGCPKCYNRPKTNRRFWDEKRMANQARDKRVGRELKARGFIVIRFFEHELKEPHKILRRVSKATGQLPKRLLSAGQKPISLGAKTFYLGLFLSSILSS